MEEQKIRSFRDLIVWQRAVEFVGKIYTITKGFPREEIYGLTAQTDARHYPFHLTLQKSRLETPGLLSPQKSLA